MADEITQAHRQVEESKSLLEYFFLFIILSLTLQLYYQLS